MYGQSGTTSTAMRKCACTLLPLTDVLGHGLVAMFSSHETLRFTASRAARGCSVASCSSGVGGRGTHDGQVVVVSVGCPHTDQHNNQAQPFAVSTHARTR